MAYIICTLPVGKISVEDILSWSAFPRRFFCRLQERLTERKKTLVFKNLTKGGGWGGGAVGWGCLELQTKAKL